MSKGKERPAESSEPRHDQSRYSERRVSTPAGLIDYAKRHLRGAQLLPNDDAELLQPRCQLYGHALELALIAFLVLKDARFGKIHNLDTLLTKAKAVGLLLDNDERDTLTVEMLNAVYWKLEHADWKLPARYSSSTAGVHAWVTPGTDHLVTLIESVMRQASHA